MSDLPQRTRIYLGPITDSTRWDAFDMREDDVFICTPPKCGTTWSQAICLMMIFGEVAFDSSLTTLSPWLESSTRDIDDMNAALNSQANRRCIKSHTPMDGIIYDPSASYIAVYRHPLDVHFSMRNHAANMDNGKLDHLFPDDPRTGALMFINDIPPVENCDHMTLETFVTHYKSFKKWEKLPNVHLFHYATMKADLTHEMQRFADILGYDFSPDKMADLVEGATFDAMRKKPAQFTPAAGMGFFKDDAKFFNSASSNKWARHLNEDDIAQYSARMDALLPKNERKWLETGSST